MDAEILQNPEGEKIDLAEVLKKHGFDTTLSKIHFPDTGFPSLKGMKLSGISFEKCTFDWSPLSASEIDDSHFLHCIFKNASFTNAHIRNSTFENCEFKEAMFVNSKLSNVRFLGSPSSPASLVNSSFEDTEMSDCHFEHVKMPGTHFLAATVSRCGIKHADLTNTAFFGTRKSFDIAHAVIDQEAVKFKTATLVFSEGRGISVPLFGEKLANIVKTTPIRIAMESPSASKEDVYREVESILRPLQDSPPTNGETIPQRLIKTLRAHPEKYPHAASIVAKADKVFEKFAEEESGEKKLDVHSAGLPGGDDLPPLSYGEDNHGAKFEGDYRRMVMEMALIDQCVNKGIPLKGVCRGFQAIAVYFGAKLVQHVGDHVGVQILGQQDKETAQGTGLFGNALKGIVTALYHHQGIPKTALTPLAVSLSRTVKDEDKVFDLAMVIETMAGVPVVGSQFHSEFFKQNPHVFLGPSDLTNEELQQQADAYVDPKTGRTGLRNPADMVRSGILEQHMSPANDQLWAIFSDVIHTCYGKKSIVTDAALEQIKADLRTYTPAGGVSLKRTSDQAQLDDPEQRERKRPIQGFKPSDLRRMAGRDARRLPGKKAGSSAANELPSKSAEAE